MSALKEEWASLMKLRESGHTDESKKQEIKSRIFNNFYTLRQEFTKSVPESASISIKPEYLSMRQQFLNTVISNDRAKTPEIPKKFEFGLKNVTPPPSQHKKNRIDIKSEEIWKIDETPSKLLTSDIVQDHFEMNSITENNFGSLSPVFQQKKINIFSDLSPITRILSTITEEDEEKYLKQVKSHENRVYSLFHLVNAHADDIDLDNIDWDSMKKICTGTIFKSEIKNVPQPVKNISNYSENPKNIVSQAYSEPPFLLDSSLLKPNNLKSSNSTSPFLQIEKNENSMLEQDLLEMMDLVKDKDNIEDIEKKLANLLEHAENKLKSSKDISGNMHIRVLYQFLLEYLKKNEKKEKPAPNRRVVQSKPTQKKNITPNKPKVINKVQSNSSLNSNKSNKWIGGGKYQADFDDDDWVSLNQEKKKKETRHEQLYKLSMKEKK